MSSVLVVGSTALDSIKTPYQENPRLLGGSASHAAVAAGFFSPVNLVGVVGDDFPSEYVELYKRHGINIDGLEHKSGQTFHWSGEYEVNMNNRETLSTILGVIEGWQPKVPDSYKKTPYVLLANMAPDVQHAVLDQMENPELVVADTMDLWMNTTKDELLRLIKRVDALVVNDSEAQLLTGYDNVVVATKKIHDLGPKYVIVKKGEHGAILSGPNELFIAPAYPLEKLVDPTGAGDSFVGGMMGYLASREGGHEKNLRKGIVYGTIVASFCCEGFGLHRTGEVTGEMIESRTQELKKMSEW